MTDQPVSASRSGWFRRSRRVLLVGLALLLGGGLTAGLWGPPLLQRYALSFRVNNPEKSDAICILLGEFRVRPMRASELFLRGFGAEVLIVDFPEDMVFGNLESQLAQVIMLKTGIPPEKLVRLRGRVTSTAEEARFYRDYAEKKHLKSLLVVTSAFHTRRSRWIFERVFKGSGIRLSYAAARQPHIDELNWYTTDEGLVTYFSETLKTLYYYIRY